MKKSIWLLALVLSLCSWSLAYGETADGQTPAEETICDKAGYTGALWGLCNAYCEAMDCGSKATNASDAACERVLKNFISKSPGGKLPPCGFTGDPCMVRCYSIYQKSMNICEKEYDIGMANCEKDPLCEEDVTLKYNTCSASADDSYDYCTSKCGGKICAYECQELRQAADEKCYAVYCKDGNCQQPDYNLCLDNSYLQYKKCMIKCDGVIIK